MGSKSRNDDMGRRNRFIGQPSMRGDVSLTMPSSLERRLTTSDAVIIGLGAMLGAGVFASFAPAARAANNALLLGLGIAAIVAYCNATASARLAALYPESGGTYVYGRRRLGSFWGFLAGWGFVVGKLASCAAMAMTFGSYAAPSFARPLAIVAVVALTAVNYLGIQKTAWVTRIIVACVLLALAIIVIAVWFGGSASIARLWPLEPTSLRGVLEAAGFCFFAFAGYARIATLGEEVRDPERTIPRAISIALALTLVVYVIVAASALAGAGATVLAESKAPLATAMESGNLAFLSPAVRIGAAIASCGVLLSLIAGLSRTIFAMARTSDLPRYFAEIHPVYRVPYRADLAIGGLVAIIVAVSDIRSAIGFSSFAVLTYYAIANASAWTVGSRWIAGTGLLGCIVLAFALPFASVLSGVVVLALGALVYWAKLVIQGGESHS